MAQDATELVVAANGNVFVAPVGTPLPTDPDSALDAAFVNLGFVSEDGVTISVTPQIEEFRAWQARQPVRREFVGQDISLSFALEQWNADNVILAFGGGEVSEPQAGEFRYDFPHDEDSLDERAIVVEWQDNTKVYKACFERGNVTETVETSLVRSSLAMLPITFSVLAPSDGGSPGFIIADDPAFHS